MFSIQEQEEYVNAKEVGRVGYTKNNTDNIMKIILRKFNIISMI